MRRLFLGLFLIVFTSSILLLSDLKHHQSSTVQNHNIAVLQYASRPIMDDTVEGMIRGLKDRGYVDGNKISLTIFNAENDMPTAAAIATELTGGKYDLVLTASTPCMQAVANANQQGKTIHVFGAVTDPFASGVGLNRDAPLDHPRHLVGVGTFQPVVEVFRLAKECFPGLERVGIVWNPAEACSEACTKLARQISDELGIRLFEANVDNSSGVLEAANALTQKDIQAFWVGGDNTVGLAVQVLIEVAKKAKIPVISNAPVHAEAGALLCLGANYFDVGVLCGQMAGDILKGKDPSTIAIKNKVPQKLALNKQTLLNLKGVWNFPGDILEKADIVIDKHGNPVENDLSTTVSLKEDKNETDTLTEKLSRPVSIQLIKFLDSPASEQSEAGVYAGLEASGLIENKDYFLKARSAQGDIATLRMLVDAAVTDDAQMLITLSTPTLQTAINRIKNIPVIFTHVADPIVAGAGQSNTDHLPNITGAYNLSDYEGLIRTVSQCVPQARTMGTLFSPSELNSVFHKNKLTEAGQRLGIKIVSVGANSSVDIFDAAMSLCADNIDAICQIADNLCDGSFSSIAQAAEKNAVPLAGFASHNLKSGAFLVLARDFEDTGKEAGLIAARVIEGENPEDIPFNTIRTSKLSINKPVAARLGIQIPSHLLQQAVVVIK